MSTPVTKQGCSRQLSSKKFFFIDATKRSSSSSSSTTISTTTRFRLPRRATAALFPLRFLRQLGNKVVGALNMFSSKGKGYTRRTKQASSTVAQAAGRTKPTTTMAPIIDSHRAEAINDCIQFINSSSSSLPRTDSVSEKDQQQTH